MSEARILSFVRKMKIQPVLNNAIMTSGQMRIVYRQTVSTDYNRSACEIDTMRQRANVLCWCHQHHSSGEVFDL